MIAIQHGKYRIVCTANTASPHLKLSYLLVHYFQVFAFF